MTKQTIYLGGVEDDGTGTPHREYLGMINGNFDELYRVTGDANDIASMDSYDSAAAHTAINASLVANATTVVPAGSHTIGTQISIPSNRRLIIQPGATITLADGVDGAMIVNADSSNANIEIRMDGTLSGNGANQASDNTGHGILITSGVGVNILGSGLIQDCASYGLKFVSCVKSIAAGLRQTGRTDGKSSGFNMTTSKSCIFAHLLATANTGSSPSGGYGFFVLGTLDAGPQDSGGNSLLWCEANGNDDDGIALFDSVNDYLSHCKFNESVSDKGAHFSNARGTVVEDTEFCRNALAGVAMGMTSTHTPGVTLRRCKFNENGDDGFELNTSNARFLECDAVGNSGRGYRVYYGTPQNNTWIGGMIGNNTMAGISLEGGVGEGAKNNLIDQVNFFDTQATKTQDYAVQDGANVGTGNLITRCRILPQQTAAVSLTSTSEGTGDLANVKL